MNVKIYFSGDWSVGIPCRYFEMEIPDQEKEFLEDTRKLIRELYTELDGEETPEVYFENELGSDE